jgi:hypothetical protein
MGARKGTQERRTSKQENSSGKMLIGKDQLRMNQTRKPRLALGCHSIDAGDSSAGV